jgi:hypothetical protein
VTERAGSPLAHVSPPAGRIAAATALALCAAALLLVVAVLPAEYGIDPLGTGRALGLSALAEPPQRALAPQPRSFKRDAIEFTLGPYQSVEYKYRIERGASLLYAWSATRRVSYDLHGEPEDAPAGAAESFEQQEGERAQGTFTAPFSGLHGWYWENGGGGDVTIRLRTAGFYTSAQEYFDGRILPRALTDADAAWAPER